jgi:hypothetical protein
VVRSSCETLDETETFTDHIARMCYEGSGLTAKDIDIFNPYDGFTLFFQYFLEGFQWRGVKRGEAHDFYAGDISVEGPNPLSSVTVATVARAGGASAIAFSSCADKRAIARSGLGTRPRSPVRLLPAIPTGWSTARIRIEI